jgi:hypothetical protein
MIPATFPTWYLLEGTTDVMIWASAQDVRRMFVQESKRYQPMDFHPDTGHDLREWNKRNGHSKINYD